MKLKCGGCDVTLEADTEDGLADAMRVHGREAHGGNWEGKTPEEIKEMEGHMDAHVRNMIKEQNS